MIVIVVATDAPYAAVRLLDVRKPSTRRPRFHVVRSVKISAPMRSATQPPCGIFGRFAPQNARSMMRKPPAMSPAFGRLHPHRSRARK